MKRFGNLYPQLCSLENITQAHINARRGKRHYPAVVKVDGRQDIYLPRLHKILLNHQFENSAYDVFFKTGRKKNRWIYKLPYYPDRIVHHAVVQIMEPVWDKILIRDTYSSIKNRGIHDGVRRMKGFLQDVPGTKYCLKMDVHKFYPSVDHDILKTILRRKIKCAGLLSLLDKIIDSGEGVPIGNYLSQYFGNLYLSGYDHWMKEVQKVKYYSRYCDDIVVLSDDKKKLHELHHGSREYLSTHLNLFLKKGTRVFPVDSGTLDYMGYVFKHDHVRVRKSIVQEFKAKIRRIKKHYLRLPATQIINTVMSYYGWFTHANARNLWKKYMDKEMISIMSYVCYQNNIKSSKIIRSIT